MEGLLNEVSTTKSTIRRALVSEVGNEKEQHREAPKSLEDATNILRDAPDLNSLRAILKLVDSSPDLCRTVRQPSAKTTPFLAVLINDVLPDYWSQIHEDEENLRATVTRVLRGLPAINAVISRLKTLIKEGQENKTTTTSSFLSNKIDSAISILEAVLLGNQTLYLIWTDITELGGSAQQRLLRAEAIQLLANSRVPSVVAQAQDIVRLKNNHASLSWLGNGREYTLWLAKNTAHLAARLDASKVELGKEFAQLFSRSLGIGYADHFMETFMSECLNESQKTIELLTKLIAGSRVHEQKSLFTNFLRMLDERMTDSAEDEKMRQRKLASLSGIIRRLIDKNESLSDQLVEILVRSESINWMASLAMRKAAIMALSDDRATLDIIFDRALGRFADDLFIVHGPVLHQESVTQVLLLSAGLIHQRQPARLRTYAKSARFVNSISLHLKSNSARVRSLGMIVGSGVSSLIDDKDHRLEFDNDTLDATDAEKFLDLLQTKSLPLDQADLGLFFKQSPSSQSLVQQPKYPNLQLRPKVARSRKNDATKKAVSNISKILELADDDDLVPYAKPDSDPEDDDEDPTLVNRDKPKPPVYIRDLMVGLRDTEDYDKHHMALITAASLIRRKAGFGKEVKDHIQELASILMNLNNNFDFDDFTHLREETLIAVLIADPIPVAQYYAKSAFEGDFSIQQRTALLAAMGLGARELAAFKDDERAETPSFPSKELPDHLKQIYGEQPTALSRVAVRVQRSATEPLALKAADEISGPNALKVRTFSSRVAKEKTRKRPAANELAKIVGDAFFFPLTARWWIHARAASQGSASSPFASPMLLPVYLRTLAIIFHAAGSWAMALPQMTAEFWTILLAVRGAALGAREYPVLEALLFGLLILLEVNNENAESIARERSRELLETQEWCKVVLNEIAGGDSESNQIRSLAASVIMRSQEVIERWQRLMVGNMIDL